MLPVLHAWTLPEFSLYDLRIGACSQWNALSFERQFGNFVTKKLSWNLLRPDWTNNTAGRNLVIISQLLDPWCSAESGWPGMRVSSRSDPSITLEHIRVQFSENSLPAPNSHGVLQSDGQRVMKITRVGLESLTSASVESASAGNTASALMFCLVGVLLFVPRQANPLRERHAGDRWSDVTSLFRTERCLGRERSPSIVAAYRLTHKWRCQCN